MFEQNGPSVDKFGEDLKKLAQDVADMKKYLEWGQEKMPEWRKEAMQSFEVAKKEAAASAQQVDGYVRENAWTSIIIAAVIGAVVAMLASHKNSR